MSQLLPSQEDPASSAIRAFFQDSSVPSWAHGALRQALERDALDAANDAADLHMILLASLADTAVGRCGNADIEKVLADPAVSRWLKKALKVTSPKIGTEAEHETIQLADRIQNLLRGRLSHIESSFANKWSC